MGWFFWFKRGVGLVAQPLTIFFLLAFACLALWHFRRWQRIPCWFLTIAVLLLFAASFPPFTQYLARRLEMGHMPLQTADAVHYNPAAVVVLGNGVAFPDERQMPALTRLNDTARARLVEGVRLAGLFPDAALVVTGNGMGYENCADAMAEAAIELGVEQERVVRLPESMDTRHEAELVADLVGDGEVVVVTTAVHMKRTLRYFRAAGMRTVPAPCDYKAPAAEHSLTGVEIRAWRPKGINISDSEEIWHEYLGLLYQRWFGVTADGE